jgi:homoserine kinase type II
MNITDIWKAWPIAGPWQLFLLAGGTNNTVWRAEAEDGQRYVLRFIPDLERLPRIRYEATLLEALVKMQPPFLLPLPLKANNEDVAVLVEQETGHSSLATLTHLLPGHLPNRNDLTIAANAGTCLAWLDSTLATLPETFMPTAKQVTFPTYGQLTLCHPLVPDPLAAVERLPINNNDARQMRQFLERVMASVDDLYDQLPQQLLHSDYAPVNILVDNRQVTAILDFEFAGVDLRALEVCIALSWWIVNVMGTGKEWDVLNAFGVAYTKDFPLSEPELLAFPALWRLRDATSFVHRMGRYFAGLETDARMQERVQHSFWREA